mmetsp:Transcript_16713/g.25248  ORF Transcript_16713/g.25248 Transcript_16713/m.25248 type:complete len:96 (-) Transcript_16713:1226-1513(-)
MARQNPKNYSESVMLFLDGGFAIPNVRRNEISLHVLSSIVTANRFHGSLYTRETNESREARTNKHQSSLKALTFLVLFKKKNNGWFENYFQSFVN